MADAPTRGAVLMFAVRIHGRGGQGAVTAAELLSIAAFLDGQRAQAFPTFGSERTGAPVVAFCRIDSKPIRLREPIMEPDAVVVLDPTLLLQADVGGHRDDRRGRLITRICPLASTARLTGRRCGVSALWRRDFGPCRRHARRGCLDGTGRWSAGHCWRR